MKPALARNLKHVAAADESGDMAAGNVGEFLNYLRGVMIDYIGTDARKVLERILGRDFEFRLRRGVSLFVAGRDVTKVPSTNNEPHDNGTPEHRAPAPAGCTA